MTRKPTGAERYFEAQIQDPDFLAAYKAARREIDACQAGASEGSSASDD